MLFREGLFYSIIRALELYPQDKKGREKTQIAITYLCGVGRILAIDYGKKKTGLAVTDPLKIIASPLETIASQDLIGYLLEYAEKEQIEVIVVGEPFHSDGRPAQFHAEVMKFVKKLKKLFPQIPVELHDETNTSLEAKDILLRSGSKKKRRRQKTVVDRIAAALILESYLIEKGIH